MRRSIWKRFGRHEGGTFAVSFAAASVVVLGAAGYAVDVAHLHHMRSSLQSALDAAVTSTARDLTTGKIAEADARPTVQALLSGNAWEQIGQDRTRLDRLDVDGGRRSVEASARMEVDLFFPFFDEDGRAEVSVEAAALYSDREIEVAMMLDITGSMKGQKIEDLKLAAANAVRAFLGDQDPARPRIRVAIVPYAEAVNTGKFAEHAVFAETKDGPDLPPPIRAENAAAGKERGDGSEARRPDNCATERKLPDGTADFSDDSPRDVRVNRKGREYRALVNRDDRVWVCPQAAVVPLTADAEALLATIEDFNDDGVTAGAIAAQWGYYMLSPKWRQTIRAAGLGRGPADYNGNVGKVAILMTDGQFNTAFAGVARDAQPQMHQGRKSRNHAQNICAAMKRDGIEVFTIGFALDDPGMTDKERREARAVLEDCASEDRAEVRHFFDVSTGPELDRALQEIVRNSERVVLTQ